MGRELFVFRSKQNARLFAFTRNMTGANLPDQYGPWQPSIIAAVGEPSDVVLSAIETRGFYLSRSDGNAW